ncbi:MAG: ATP-binding protein [Anaerolineae bacterium]
MPKIKVHEKALAHLSSGLYRSPASALRELVSNALDANATTVQISTNYPGFYTLAVEDNGDGFSREDFEEIMEGGVGNSTKRSAESPLLYGRAVIGRLGIGMFGIAQICGSFRVTSVPRKGKGFTAEVHLHDLLRQRLDDDDQAVVVDEQDAARDVYIGEYDFHEFEAPQGRCGTTIIATDVHPTFIHALQSSLGFEAYRDPDRVWRKALSTLSSVHTLRELGDYWRLLWELAVSCPVAYVGEDALPDGLAAPDHARLLGHNFRLFVDGIELRKPVLLSGNQGGYTIERLHDVRHNVYGRPLEFHGYLLVQEGVQLRPDELRGILIRIKDVGIGYYDASLLDYRYNEGPRSRWLTGEIYVDKGLEDALNIDRDSFNRTHPEFRKLQEHVHTVLHDQVFPQSYRQINVRSRARTKVAAEKRAINLRDTVAHVLNSPVTVVDAERPADAHALPKASLQVDPSATTVHLPQSGSIKTKAAHRQLAASIMALYEVAMLEQSDEARRETFTRLLLSLFSRW